MKLAIVLLAFWFGFQAFHSMTIVGPFKNKDACEKIRKKTFETYDHFLSGTYVTDCWWDGEKD